MRSEYCRVIIRQYSLSLRATSIPFILFVPSLKTLKIGASVL